MHHSRTRTALRLLVIAALSAGCSSGDQTDAAATDSAAIADSTATVASAPAPSVESSQAPLAVADIDRWQKGMEAELEAVREAGVQLRNAKTSTDSLNALAATNEMSTRAAGARAAGVDEERYQRIRTTLSPVVGQMAPIEQEMDLSKAPASMVAELKKSRAEGLARVTSELPADLVEALRPRAAELRKQDLTLTAERLKAAGMTR